MLYRVKPFILQGLILLHRIWGRVMQEYGENRMQNYYRLCKLFLRLAAYGSVNQRNVRLQVAINWLEAVTVHFPKEPQLQYHLGQFYRRLGELVDARKTFANAIALWGNSPSPPDEYINAHIELAGIWHTKGELATAVSYFQASRTVQQQLATSKQLSDHKYRYLTGPWVTSIGIIALLDFYAKAQILGLHDHEYIVLAPQRAVINPCYLDYWRPYITIVTNPIQIQRHRRYVPYLEDHPSVLPIRDQWLWMHDALPMVQQQWESEGRSPLLTLTDEHRHRGEQTLWQMGIPNGAWFVCLHVREAGFHRQEHDPRTERNAAIADYQLAIQTIIDLGGWVIRMGDPSMTHLAPQTQVIDYAHSQFKRDWMDIFLCASCRFFIGTNSGLCWVPSTFGVPCVLTNWAPLAIQSWYSKDIMIPKLLWSEPHQRHLTFAEHLQPPFAHTEASHCLAAHGVKPVSNTPEQIRDVVLEILARLDGNLQYTPADQSCQAMFQQHLADAQVLGSSRIGQLFLRQYAHLL